MSTSHLFCDSRDRINTYPALEMLSTRDHLLGHLVLVLFFLLVLFLRSLWI
jgi:hypothetical protein